MKTFLRWIASVVLFLVVALTGAVLILEWMSGCGETYIDAKGNRHHGECIVIPHKPSQPTYHPPTSKP